MQPDSTCADHARHASAAQTASLQRGKLLANYRCSAHLQALIVHLRKPCCTPLGYAVSLSRILSKTHAHVTNVGDSADLCVQVL